MIWFGFRYLKKYAFRFGFRIICNSHTLFIREGIADHRMYTLSTKQLTGANCLFASYDNSFFEYKSIKNLIHLCCLLIKLPHQMTL